MYEDLIKKNLQDIKNDVDDIIQIIEETSEKELKNKIDFIRKAANNASLVAGVLISFLKRGKENNKD